MRIFSGGIATETNTFAPVPTGAAAYEEHGAYGRGQPHPRNEATPIVDALNRLAREGGHELVEGLFVYATPGGTTLRGVYEALRAEFLAGLRAAMPVDAVVLPLHGAMVAEGYFDCEGDLLDHVRAIVGPRVPIGVALDLHCHLSERMRLAADVIVAFKEYPHTDIIERLEETWQLTLDTARRAIDPVTAVHDCKMVSAWFTTEEPVRSFVRRMQALEGRDGVLSVNFGHGFPYGDVPDNGAKVWVVTDRRVDPNGSRAAGLAKGLGDEIWAMRKATRPRLLSLDAALDRIGASTSSRPLVIADSADNAGGGAASDSTFVLRRILERGIGNVAIGAFWDVVAARVAADVGVGASLELRIGGKFGRASGDPVDVRVTVRAVVPHHVQTGLASSFDCGLSAWVQTESGVDIVLISTRHQVFGTDLFTGLGIDLAAKRAVVVKSAQHFRAEFERICSDIVYASTPGLMRDDFENLPFVHRSLRFWPRVANPWQAEETS